MKKIYSVNVTGPCGYSFAVAGEGLEEDDVIDVALENDLFSDEEDSDYAVVEDITDSEYDINGLKDATFEVPEKKKYVIRHYWRAWVDITVEATSEEEAYEKAGDRYNMGDYEDDPSLGNFENTDVANVTDTYVKNNLPFPNEE